MTTTAVLPTLSDVNNTTITDSNVTNGSMTNIPDVTNATTEYSDYGVTNDSVTTSNVTALSTSGYDVTSATISVFDITNATIDNYDGTTTSQLRFNVTNATLLDYDITNGTMYETSTYHIVMNETMNYDDVSTLNPYVITTNSNVIDGSVLDTVTLAASVIAIVCYFCVLGLLIGMGLSGIRSHIHSNVCVSLLTTHGLLLVGAQQIPGTTQCKAVSIITQFFILVGFTWLLLEGIQLFRLSMIGAHLTQATVKPSIKLHKDNRKQSTNRSNRSDSVTSQSPLRHHDTSRKKSSKSDQFKVQRSTSCCSRITSYYVIGWFIPALFIGATIPTALNGYGLSENCWIASHDEVIWVFGAPIPAIFLFHFVVIILAIRNFKRKIEEAEDQRRRGQSSKQSSSKATTSRFSSTRSRVSSGRHRPSAVHSVRTASGVVMLLDDVEEDDGDVIQQEDELSSYESDDHHVLGNHHDHGANDVVRVHPPLHEVNHQIFAVTLPDKNEGCEPPQNYLTAVYWQAWLVPLVCATWTCGLTAINFRLVELEYTFCVMNVLQALYIFCYYCVVTFRLRQRWHVMTSREINRDARPVTVLLGDDSDDAYDVINGKRMRAGKRKKKKIPNYDLLTRTPTPFGEKSHFRELDSSESSGAGSNPTGGMMMKNLSNENRQSKSTVIKQYRDSYVDNASNITLQSENISNNDAIKSFQLPGFSGADSDSNLSVDEAMAEILETEIKKPKNVKIRPKKPFVKSVSDNDVLNKRQTLRQTNSYPMSDSVGDLIDINSVISDDPFTSTDNLLQDGHTDSKSSGRNRLSFSVTPPSMIDSSHHSPTVSQVLKTHVSPKYENVIPSPRHTTRRFAQIAIKKSENKEKSKIRAKKTK